MLGSGRRPSFPRPVIGPNQFDDPGGTSPISNRNQSVPFPGSAPKFPLEKALWLLMLLTIITQRSGPRASSVLFRQNRAAAATTSSRIDAHRPRADDDVRFSTSAGPGFPLVYPVFNQPNFNRFLEKLGECIVPTVGGIVSGCDCSAPGAGSLGWHRRQVLRTPRLGGGLPPLVGSSCPWMRSISFGLHFPRVFIAFTLNT